MFSVKIFLFAFIIQVLQTDIVFDVGKSLNPAIDIGQIEGAFVQGLGMVTSEFTEADEHGRLTNCSPLSYKIPNVRSIPRKLNVTLLKNYNVETPVYSSKVMTFRRIITIRIIRLS